MSDAALNHTIRSSGDESTITDIGSMVVTLIRLPFVARFINRFGSRIVVWVEFVPHLGGLASRFGVTA